MKAEDEPIAEDELVLRLIWHTKFVAGRPIPVSEASFEPRNDDVSGISVFRLDCLSHAADILRAVGAETRHLYFIAKLSVALLRADGLDVVPAKIPEVAGHAEIPGLSAVTWKENRKSLRAAIKRLAVEASAAIVFSPGDLPP